MFQGLEGVTRGYSMLQGVSRSYMELQGVTGGYKGLQGVTRVTVTIDFRGLHRVRRAYRG